MLWHCWLGGRKGIRPVKKLSAGMVICLELGADLHMAQLMPLPLTVSCFNKIQIGFTFLVSADPVVSEKGPLNGRVCYIIHSIIYVVYHTLEAHCAFWQQYMEMMPLIRSRLMALYIYIYIYIYFCLIEWLIDWQVSRHKSCCCIKHCENSSGLLKSSFV